MLVQDYHLALVPGMLRELPPRPADRPLLAHPVGAGRTTSGCCPTTSREQLLRGMLGADRAAFLTRRWADAFTALLRTLARSASGAGTRGRTTRIGVHGLGADADFLRERVARGGRRRADGRAARSRSAAPAAKTIVRVDRTELSKNIVRGLLAYRQLLDDHPEWRERVVHVAFAYPSRQDLAVYREYTAEVQRVAEEINAAYGTPDWTRSCCTSRTTSPARWPRTGWRTWRWSTRSATA